MTEVVDIVLVSLLAATGFALVRVRNLFAVTMLFGIYSLLAAALFVVLDAVDVALTEAAVGAGVSVVLMLSALALVGKDEKVNTDARRPWLALLVVLVTGSALVYATLDMPRFGDPDAPGHQHVSPRYVQDSPEEIGIPNIVTSVLASYRGYDTLGEVLVIFSAGLGVMLLLGSGVRNRGSQTREPGLSEYIVLRVVAKLMMPLILLFALYVQLHGEYSPGGGFQAGVIFAAAIVLYALIFGLSAAQQVIPVRVAHAMAAIGGLIYLSVGVWALFAGGQFLEYKVLFDDPQVGETVGIVVIELGVGTTVAGVAMSLFYSFAGRNDESVGADL